MDRLGIRELPGQPRFVEPILLGAQLLDPGRALGGTFVAIS